MSPWIKGRERAMRHATARVNSMHVTFMSVISHKPHMMMVPFVVPCMLALLVSMCIPMCTEGLICHIIHHCNEASA